MVRGALRGGRWRGIVEVRSKGGCGVAVGTLVTDAGVFVFPRGSSVSSKLGPEKCGNSPTGEAFDEAKSANVALRFKLTSALLFGLVFVLWSSVNGWFAILALFLSGVCSVLAGLADRGSVLTDMALTNAHPMLSYRDKVGRSDLGWIARGILPLGSHIFHLHPSAHILHLLFPK